jgi:NAD-dependent dihydropyrimidine dehydrogenase PreA subunit
MAEGNVRKLIEDPSFPREWPVKEQHIEHKVHWKQGDSKEYGVHGTEVGVDFDICIADGICITVCPVNVFDRMELEGEAAKMEKGITNDSGKAPLATWKADPAREKDCIFCRACEIQCPVQAIKITEP